MLISISLFTSVGNEPDKLCQISDGA